MPFSGCSSCYIISGLFPPWCSISYRFFLCIFPFTVNLWLNKIIYCRFIPFSGGPRKCVGDQFALLEAIVALAIFIQHLNFELVPDQNISMTTGATIHTTNVTFLNSHAKTLLHRFHKIQIRIRNIRTTYSVLTHISLIYKINETNCHIIHHM